MSHPNELLEAGVPQLGSTTMVHSAMRFLNLLRRNKPILIAALAAAAMLGALYYGSAPRVYRSQAQVFVQILNPSSDAVKVDAGRNTIEQMATYQRLFTSTVVLESAVQKLSELPPEVDPQDTPSQQLEDIRELVQASALRTTTIIELSCCSESPSAAMNMVEAIVAAYIEYIDVNHQSVTAELVSSYREEKSKLHERLLQTEQELREVSLGTNDFNPTGDDGFVHPAVQTVIELNKELSTTHQRRVRVEASLASFRKAVTTGGDLRQHLVGLEPLLGKELMMNAMGIGTEESQQVAATEQRIYETQAKLKSLQRFYLENHPKVTSLMEQIESDRAYIASLQSRVNHRLAGLHDEQLARMLTGLLEEDLARTWEQEKQLARAYREAERRAVEYKDSLTEKQMLEREYERQLQTFTDLSNKLAKLEISDGQNDVRASVVSHAALPEKPISPKLSRVGVMSLLGGIALGALIIYVRDTMDDRFRSPEEMQEQLGTPVLAMIRKHESRPGVGLETLQVRQSPDAVESEAFRTLRTTLAFSGEDYRRIVVTSSEPSDGKTTVLANLGCSFAQTGRRTLLIDCDLRKPGLTNLFDLRRSEGVSDILRSTESLAAMCTARLHPTGMDTLHVLPSGRRMPDSAEMLSQNRFAELLAWAESEYDQVLVDSPPILAAADAAMIGRLVDGVLVVVRPDKNHRRLVTRAVQGLLGFGVNVLGTVINAVSEEQGADYYGYGGYGYGYGYGAGYGEVEEAEAAEPSPSQDGGGWLNRRAA